MTTVEFNEKYKAYLGKRWYGLDIDNAEVISFLDNLFEHYLTKIEGFEYHQIKVKFGINDVRFYSNLGHINPIDTALVSAIESNISSILKLNQANNNLNKLATTQFMASKQFK
jgi:hypothetical protein